MIGLLYQNVKSYIEGYTTYTFYLVLKYLFSLSTILLDVTGYVHVFTTPLYASYASPSALHLMPDLIHHAFIIGA